MSLSSASKSKVKVTGDQAIYQLIQQLNTADLDLLNETVQALVQKKTQAAEPLVESLSHQDEELRKNIAWMLGILRQPGTEAALFQSLISDPSYDVKLSAAWALRNFPIATVKSLVFTKLKPPENFEDIAFYLASKSWKARWFCALWLGKKQVPEFFEQLKGLARFDENVVVRCAALLSLLTYSDTSVTELLIDLLGDINDHVKIEAATVLSLKNCTQATAQMLRQLQAYNENVRVSMVAALGVLGDRQVIPPLMKLLSDKSDLVRINVVMALGELCRKYWVQDQRLTQALLKALQDKNTYVVRNAARVLGFVGDEEALRSIIGLLKQETRKEVIVNLLMALGLIGDARAYNILVKHLKHKDWEVRFEVVKALSQLEHKKVVPTLLKALKDPAMRVKEQAVYGLGIHGDAKIIPHLEKLKLQHPYGKTNKAIGVALERLLEKL